MNRLPSISDYTLAIENACTCVKTLKLQGGKPIFNTDSRGISKAVMYSGGFCVVYPFVVNNEKYAVRCWHANLDDAKERTRLISEYLTQCNLPYFVKFEYIDNAILTPTAGLQPIILMDWVDAKMLKDYIEDHLRDKEALDSLASKFFEMVKILHANEISHGDLQHGNIAIKDDGSIVLVDYDSLYVPSLDGYTDIIHGLAGYQHPARFDNADLTSKADYFSELVIYLTLKALAANPEIWDLVDMKNTDTLLFSKEDLESRGTSAIFDIINQKAPSCKKIVESLIQELQCNSIDELQPLENIVKEQYWKVDIANIFKDIKQKLPQSVCGKQSAYNKSEIENIHW